MEQKFLNTIVGCSRWLCVNSQSYPQSTANKNSDIMENLNYNELKQKALKQFRSGKSLFGQDGAFYYRNLFKKL